MRWWSCCCRCCWRGAPRCRHRARGRAKLAAPLRLAPFHLDDAALAWAADTLRTLSTEQQVRQLFNVAAHGDNAEAVAALAEHAVGGVTRFGGTDLDASWRATRGLIERSEIPLLISGDIEGGAIGLPFGTALPNQLGLAATGSTALAEEAVAAC